MICRRCKATNDVKISSLTSDIVNKLMYCQDCRLNEVFDGTVEIECSEIIESIAYYGHETKASIHEFSRLMDSLVKINEKLYKNKNAIGRARFVQVELRVPEEEVVGFPVNYEDRYLTLKEDKYSVEVDDGLHHMGEKEYRIPLHRIKKITVKRDDADVYVQDVKEPIIGYKAVTEKNGMLITYGYVYEVGVPYEETQRNPHRTSYDDCYSHFCKKIEDVIFCNGKTGFIESQAKQPLELGNTPLIRLFKIKAEKHCLQNTAYGWVTNKLTLLEEVTHEELINYFNTNVIIKEKVVKYIVDTYGRSFEWEQFENAKIEPYKVEYQSEEEIYEKAIKRCFDYGKEQCKQDSCNIDKEVCNRCSYSGYPDCYKGNAESLIYMVIRYQILKRMLHKEDIACMEQTGEYDKKIIDAWYRLLHVLNET